MIALIVRLFLVFFFAAGGFYLQPFGLTALLGALLGGLGALMVILLDLSIARLQTETLLWGSLGMGAGLVLAFLIEKSILDSSSLPSPASRYFTRLMLLFGLGLLGARYGLRLGRGMSSNRLGGLLGRPVQNSHYKILDTSVIIDGRIGEICAAGFIDGAIMIPQFVLQELQSIADSSDSLKRNRGRKGLDVLQKINNNPKVEVEISEFDFPEIQEVDLKLIHLATRLGAKVVTNDFNLNKVAKLRGVEVLNINELANAMKPVVLPGETMSVEIVKEGKEANQGVGFLDDGTMVVVDDASRRIGEELAVTVTSVLQTTAGKMIFGEPKSI